MSRRLLDLCLLAYPRRRRARDRAYLRDLALDLAEAHGTGRQAWSLLLGGLKDRGRERSARIGDVSTGVRRAVAGSLSVAMLAIATYAVIGGERVHEVEQFACVTATHPAPNGVDVADECADTMRVVATREQAGWDCTAHEAARGVQRSITWECTRGSPAVA